MNWMVVRMFAGAGTNGGDLFVKIAEFRDQDDAEVFVSYKVGQPNAGTFYAVQLS